MQRSFHPSSQIADSPYPPAHANPPADFFYARSKVNKRAQIFIRALLGVKLVEQIRCDGEHQPQRDGEEDHFGYEVILIFQEADIICCGKDDRVDRLQ